MYHPGMWVPIPRNRFTLKGQLHTPRQAQVLAVTSTALICTGPLSQEAMAPWVQSTCKAAGLDPGQTIRIIYLEDLS